jgi:hypothetical protein
MLGGVITGRAAAQLSEVGPWGRQCAVGSYCTVPANDGKVRLEARGKCSRRLVKNIRGSRGDEPMPMTMLTGADQGRTNAESQALMRDVSSQIPQLLRRTTLLPVLSSLAEIIPSEQPLLGVLYNSVHFAYLYTFPSAPSFLTPLSSYYAFACLASLLYFELVTQRRLRSGCASIP